MNLTTNQHKEMHLWQPACIAWLLLACADILVAAPTPVSFELTGTMQIESRYGGTNEAKFAVKVHGREWQIKTEQGKERYWEIQHFDGTNLFHAVELGADIGGSVAEADHLRFGGNNIRVLWFAFCSEAVLKRTNWIRAPWFSQHNLPGELSYSMEVLSKYPNTDLPESATFSTSTQRWIRESAMWQRKPDFSHPQFQREFSPTNFPEGVIHARYRATGGQAVGPVRVADAFELVVYVRPGGEAAGVVTASFKAKVETALPLTDTNLSLTGIRLGVLTDYRFADAAQPDLVVSVLRPKGFMTKNDPELLEYAAKERARLERKKLEQTLKGIWPALVGPIVALVVVWLLIRLGKGRQTP